MSEEVKKFFDDEVVAYSNLFGSEKSGATYNFRRRAFLVGKMLQGAKGRFLDCATGSGEVSRAAIVAANFTNVTLVDISKKMLKKSESVVGEIFPSQSIFYEEGDIFQKLEDYAAERRKFDVVLCAGLIAHTGRLDELFSGIDRVLATEGTIVLQSTLSGHLGTVVTRALTAERYRRSKGYAISYFTRHAILEVAKSHGWILREEKHFSLGIPFADRFFPTINWWFESRLKKFSERWGSEALFRFRRGVQR
jgi:ubiquinone/menaquinone biosynthesis C-methylase UbiE